MPTYDPIEAVLDAFAAHLTAALASPAPAVVVRKGWPEDNRISAISAAPELSIVATGRPEIERCAPYSVDQVPAVAPNVSHTWRVGWVRADVQIDLWTPYRAQREERGPLVDAALANGLPHHADLHLTAANYHGRPITAVVTARRLDDDGSSAPRGLWRSSWDLRVTMDLVLVAQVPEIAELVVHTATEGPDATTEPGVTFEPTP